MIWESIQIGCCPYAEEAVQVDPKVDYIPAMKAELKRFKELLETMFPVPDDVNAHYKIEWQTHEFGRYGEVSVSYKEDDEAALDFALMVESNCPEYWPETIPLVGPSAIFLEMIQQERDRLVEPETGEKSNG